MSSHLTIEAMQAENTLLRQRIVELETSERTLRTVVQATLDHLDPVIYIRDAEGVFTLVNDAHIRLLKLRREDILGKKDSDIFPQEVWEGFRVNDRIVAETRQVVVGEEAFPFDDGVHTFRSLKFPIVDESGALIATGGVSTDITPQKRTEAALRESQSRSRMGEEIIRAQELSIRELSTPLIPIAEGVVAMPLLGRIDEARAQQIIDTLLTGVAEKHASIVILDMTGVQRVDDRISDVLVQATRAVRLLGAQVVLTGVQPQMASRMVSFDLKLDQVITLATLQSGIEFALARQGDGRRLQGHANR